MTAAGELRYDRAVGVRSLANVVSTARLILTAPFVWSVLSAPARHSGSVAAVLFAAIAISDFIDGRIARRFDATSAAGQVLDHGADIIFLLASLTAYVATGAAPWWVPSVIAVSFAVYVIDSLRRTRRRPSLIGSRVGHLGGVANYVIVGVLVGNHTVGLHWLSPAVMQALFTLVPIYSAASVLSRFAAAVRGTTLAPGEL